MKKLACALFLVLAASLSAPGSDPQVYVARAGIDGHITLPFDVTTPDGVTLPAGDYSIFPQKTLLKLVNRPSDSLGFWPGPVVQLFRVTPSEDPLAWSSYRLKTSVEVKVVYDMPGEWARRLEVRLSNPGWAPYIRNRRLVGLVNKGDILYITQTTRMTRRSFSVFVPRPIE